MSKFKVGDRVRHNDRNYSFSPGYGTVTKVPGEYEGSMHILRVEGVPVGHEENWVFFEDELELVPRTMVYADLNPRYGQSGEKRWRLFIRRGALTNIVESAGSHRARIAAELRAMVLNDVLKELDGHFIDVKDI